MHAVIYIPSFMIIIIEFDCSYEGYGDRTGQNILQMIQHHIAVINVTDGLITIMVVDGVWDEIAVQKI